MMKTETRIPGLGMFAHITGYGPLAMDNGDGRTIYLTKDDTKTVVEFLQKILELDWSKPNNLEILEGDYAKSVDEDR